MPPLSAVIITCNEERNIGRCLASVAPVAGEIVVVDSCSTDRTEAICIKAGARVFRRAWEGYSSAKNFGNAQAKGDLILSIDADEALSPELQRSIAALDGSAVAYKFSRCTNYCGTWIRHGGWYPDVKVRIFDRRKTHWEGAIHERLAGIQDKNAVLLRGDCLHYSFFSVAEHIAKARLFAGMAAAELARNGRRFGQLNCVVNPAAKFVRDYFLKLGFLDGRAGLTIAAVSAFSTYLKYRRLSGIAALRGEPL